MNLQPSSNQKLTLEWTDGKGAHCVMTGTARTVSMSGDSYGITNIEMEVQNLRVEETMAELEVYRTAAIVVEELTIDNLKRARDAAGAPDYATFTYTAQACGGFKLKFEWTD